jgi:hypothetical protein
MDRNERARQQLAAQTQFVNQMRAKLAVFAQDFATGKAAPLDRFATAIKPQDLILWHPPHDLVYEVVKVEPILNPAPNQPIGLIQITVNMTAPVQLMAGQPAMGIVIVGHQRAPGDASLNTPDGQSENPPIPPAGGPEHGPEPHDPQGEADQQTADRLGGDAAAAEHGRDDPSSEES